MDFVLYRPANPRAPGVTGKVSDREDLRGSTETELSAIQHK